ncbi:DUF4393 domain-containing protein [Lactiplantibacillus pentosus]|uniref:DUF4393 domain-containing protein n=1 Tax=Lactiplantibacillus pentosus TaxID=1589 RepID=UPI003D2EA47B
MDPSKFIPTEPVNKALNPTAEAIGDSLGGIAKTVLYPFLKWNIFVSKNLDDFEDKIKAKTDSIPIDQRDSSKFGLAMKAMDEAKYQLDSDALRELFANLIASSVDKRKNDNISPRFATILGQLSPEDAQVLLKIYEQQNGLVATALIKRGSTTLSGSSPISSRLMLFSTTHTEAHDISLDTLSSLGVIDNIQDGWLTSDVYTLRYDNVKKLPIYSQFESQIDLTQYKLSVEKGYLRLSNFGTSLCQSIL